MITIRREQMEVLRAWSRRQYEKALAAHLSQRLPARARALGDEGLRAFVTEAVDRAFAHGIEVEGDVTRYSLVLLGVDREFERAERYGWARPILADAGIDGRLKMDLIEEQLQQAGDVVADAPDHGGAHG